jgi:hypothetical protein
MRHRVARLKTDDSSLTRRKTHRCCLQPASSHVLQRGCPAGGRLDWQATTPAGRGTATEPSGRWGPSRRGSGLGVPPLWRGQAWIRQTLSCSLQSIRALSDWLKLVAECRQLGRKTVMGALNRPHNVFGLMPAKMPWEVDKPTLPSGRRGRSKRIKHAFFRPYGRKSKSIETASQASDRQEIGSAITVQPYPAGRSPVLDIIETQQVQMQLGRILSIRPASQGRIWGLVMRHFRGSCVPNFLWAPKSCNLLTDLIGGSSDIGARCSQVNQNLSLGAPSLPSRGAPQGCNPGRAFRPRPQKRNEG